ncbi:YbjN domain-containing protein [Pseudomonas chlororaphis]|uniref:YbjN domain-containing protein n=1 Tax=Pseudomonas chlororaphis TaxID=587753 RepID=UPI0039E6EE58
MTTAQYITHVSAEHLTELMQASGYRVNRSEQNAVVQLLSASQGIGYAVRFGNAAKEAGSYFDFTFSCALRVQGELPAGIAERWNASRRFARMSIQGEFLVMEMDVTVAAGVSPDHLRSNLELWDRLLQEFITYLRDYSQQAARLQAEEDAADAEPVALHEKPQPLEKKGKLESAEKATR